jgi:predicted AAA+ superfamily ATPase
MRIDEEDLRRINTLQLGAWTEWVVAQELWRRLALGTPEDGIYYWQSKQHELVFVTADSYYEIKVGKASPSEFLWFPKVFPHERLTVVSSERFETRFLPGSP